MSDTPGPPDSTPLGMHVSIAGGLPKAVDRAVRRGCRAFQIFCGNPRGWTLRRPEADEIDGFRRRMERAGLKPLFVHCCYLVNPCAGAPSVFRRSVERLARELERSAELGAAGCVLHPGSARGRAPDRRLARAAETVTAALERAERSVELLLEGTASRHGPGGSFGELRKLMDRVRERVPGVGLGVCVDSCHVFGAGYDLRRREEVDRLVRDLDDTVGLSAVRLLHLNDSRVECGSGRDRHHHLGRGTIGEEGLRNFAGHPAFRGLPVILETPWESPEDDRRNLRTAADLLG